MIKAGADVNAVGEISGGSSPLHLAAANGFTDVATLLLNDGACLECVEAAGETPLMRAADYGHEEVVKLLLDRGAKPDAGTTTDNARALHLAVRHSYLSIVRLLLEAGANPNLRSTFQQAFGTPLEIARGVGNDEIAKLLQEHGAK